MEYSRGGSKNLRDGGGGLLLRVRKGGGERGRRPCQVVGFVGS